ncbi:MAG TPA: gephyrin-like molybdotransferase Glp [Candidatus Limnocylindrales bacterium]
MSDLLSVEAARERVLAAIPGPLRSERVDVEDALGRVLAEAARSRTDLPPWDNSAMDGYAIRSADVAAASEDSPVRLRIVGEARAGQAPDVVVGAGTAVRIATGAPLAPGADAVIPVEETTPIDELGRAVGPRGRDATGPVPAACLVHQAVAAGGSVRRRGEDLHAGAVVLEPGTAVAAAGVAIAAGAGLAELTVHARPRVGVLATGDEIRTAGRALGPAGIPDANGPGLRSLVRAAGATATSLGIASDRLDDVLGRLQAALAKLDLAIVSGGVSVGPYDVVRNAFEALGQVDLWRVAVQPGKPFAFGVAARGDGSVVPLFGLPGNPVSSFVTFELFVRPALRRLAGYSEILRPVDRALLMSAVGKAPGRRAFIRVRSRREADGGPRRDRTGRVIVDLAGGQGSHVLSALAAADGLVVVPESVDGLPENSEVELWWLDSAR